MMDKQECRNIYDLLKGSINRMFLTDDLKELEDMYSTALPGLEEIYHFHRNRILNKENGQEGETVNG